jgi:signal transduction histidine kinase
VNSSQLPPDSDSYYAPSGRSSPEELQQDIAFCLRNPVMHLALELVDCSAVILNEQRQILSTNQGLLDTLDATEASSLHGLRVGEAMGCVHVAEGPDGCGTSKACARCGAVLAVLASQALDEPISRECHLDRYESGQWKPGDFRLRATPMRLDGKRYTLAVLQDISATKRLRHLEGLFLHELGNLAQGLFGWSEKLLESTADIDTARDRIHRLASMLKEQVTQQQLLLHAEEGRLACRMEMVPVQGLFDAMEHAISRLPCAMDHRISFSAQPGQEIRTDAFMVQRVIGNMIINALEATPPDEMVKVWFEHKDGRPAFFVHNPGVIPEGVRPRIFQQSFSTKGQRGRGMGTYFMKFMGENVLSGEVGFTSTSESGTRFHLLLP